MCITQGEVPFGTLPANLRQRTNDAFAALCQRVEVMEQLLIKICICFDDDVLQAVVAIVRALRVTLHSNLTEYVFCR